MKGFIRSTWMKLRGVDWEGEYEEAKAIRTEEELSNFQEEHLKKLILHAHRNVPYYSKVFDDIGIIKEGKEVDLTRFNRIPILTKDILKKNYKELLSSDHSTRKWHEAYSGGSTGEPTKFVQDDTFERGWSAAFNYWYREIVGIDEANARKILLWGSARDVFQGSIGIKAKMWNWLNNTVLLNGFKMTEQDMERYIGIINSYKPDLIRAYAGSLYELCRFAERKGMRVHSPKVAVSAAETLREGMREKIEAVLGVKLYDWYGSREVMSLAGECRDGMMHMLAFNNHVEVLDFSGEPVREGGEGRVIVTNLHNYAMPFIRYEIGDMAVLGAKRCECGNVLPTLQRVTGRIVEQFLLEDGTVVPGEYFTHLMGVVYNRGFIRKIQVVQEDYRRVRILAVLEREMGDGEKEEIDEKIRLVMGQGCQVIWERVEDIPKAESGKYLFTRSMVWK